MDNVMVTLKDFVDGDLPGQGQVPGAAPTGLYRAAQAVGTNESGCSGVGMSLLGVAGAVTDKVVSVSVERTSVNKDLSSVFENCATGSNGLSAGVGGPVYQCYQRAAVMGSGTTPGGGPGDGSGVLQRSNSEGVMARTNPSHLLLLGDVQHGIGRSLSEGDRNQTGHSGFGWFWGFSGTTRSSTWR